MGRHKTGHGVAEIMRDEGADEVSMVEASSMFCSRMVFYTQQRRKTCLSARNHLQLGDTDLVRYQSQFSPNTNVGEQMRTAPAAEETGSVNKLPTENGLDMYI